MDEKEASADTNHKRCTPKMRRRAANVAAA